MKVLVHVIEKCFVVECGSGSQPVIWLGNVGISRYDSNFGLELGRVFGLQNEDGEILKGSVQEALKDGDHCWVLLKDDEPCKRKKHV